MSDRGEAWRWRLARTLVRAASILVPAARRAEWVEEWSGELAALADASATGAVGLPGPIGFAWGALPHAVWTKTEGWTMESVLQDVRYSARVLVRTPGFTIVAALTLALGIGANASIFSLVNGLVLRSPSGVADPDRLVQIARSYESSPRWDNFSVPAMRAIASEARAFSGVAGYQALPFVLGSGADTERVSGQLVSGSYFGVLGVTPHVGRLLQPADDIEPGAHPVLVLSHSLWNRRFGADPDVVGRAIEVASRPYVIVGVAPEGFTGIRSIGASPEVFVPSAMHPGYGRDVPLEDWGTSWIEVVGRLGEGVTFEEAQASMEIVSARLREASPVNEDISVLLAAGVGLDPDDKQQAMQISAILLLIVGLVLLLTCTNVANLFLSRATSRRTEVSVRMALGAGRGRLMRQLVTESSLLALVATLLAVPIVLSAGELLPLVFPYTVSVSLGPDARVFAFLIVTGLATGLLFGVAPAWSSSKRDVPGALRESASTGPRSRTRLRDALVVSQLGLSLGLVAGAALLGRSVLNARSAEPGFEPRGLVAGYVDLRSTGRYDDDQGLEFFVALMAEADSRPDVRSATLASQLPIAGVHGRRSVRPMDRDDVSIQAEYTVVGPHYFETLGIPMVRGRALGGFDDEPERVVVVNEALASMFWPGRNPVGQELQDEAAWRVVGVVADVQMRSLRESANPAVYYPIAQSYSSSMALHLSSESGRAPSAELVREIVASVDPELPVSSVVDLQAAIVDSMGETRTIGYLVGAFALLALVLATVGLYGLVSYGASQRVRELGIRIALGARPESLVRLILAKSLVVCALGIGLGFIVAYGLGLALGSLLFGVASSDPLTLAAAAAVLATVSALAAWLPASRASRVDPAVSLRDGVA